ncbi:YwmB family TATA-box binding protein [Virgibacillus sp. W0181]|uniref:YwmB family TATA-box binding protein n=1 Tax=Virgibacillus sp. W0181 TaxID=3391581 RepID=UPI003F46D11E
MKNTILFTAFIFLLITSTGTAQPIERDELILIATFLMEHKQDIAEWEVIVKEKISNEKAHNLLKELKDSHLVTVTEDENVIKYVIGDTNKGEPFSVYYNVIIPKQRDHAEIVAVINGDYWDHTVLEKYRSYMQTNIAVFTQSSQLFTCLKTTDSGIMDISVLLDSLQNNFNLLHMSTQTDTVENSTHKKLIYGYTPLWETKIPIKNSPVNIQIVEKGAGPDQSNLTIGTPILVNEY